jgi:hypothetical protein
MNEKAHISELKLKEVFLDSFIAALRKDIERQKGFLVQSDNIFDTYYERIERIGEKQDITKFINETNWLKATLNERLEKEYPEKREIPFDEEFEIFFRKTDEFIQTLPEKLKEEQAEGRFVPLAGNVLGIKILKWFKGICFKLSRLPHYFTNLIRKEKHPIRRWSHTIPLSNMVRYYFVNTFIGNNLQSFEDLMRLKCNTLNTEWGIIKDINLELNQFLNGEISREDFKSHLKIIVEKDKLLRSRNELDRKLSIWKERAEEELLRVKQQYEKDLPIVGTVELSEEVFARDKLQDKEKENRKSYRRIFIGWKNALFAQLDDIQVDVELLHIKYNALLHFHLLKNSFQLRINKTVKEKIKLINDHFDGMTKKLSGIENKKNLDDLLEEERLVAKNKLERIVIPNAIDAIYNQDLPNLLDRLKYKIEEQVNDMKPERLIYSSGNYTTPINRSELSHFNPRELVHIDIFSHFSAVVDKTKTAVVQQLEKLENDLSELSNIIDYNLDSAINSSSENDELSVVKSIANEGIARTKAKTKAISEELLKLNQLIESKLQDALHKMNEELVKLTINENIINLRLKLATARAMDKTQGLRQKLNVVFREQVPALYGRFMSRFKKGVQLGNKYLVEFGLADKDKKLTAELSEFLLKTDEAVDKLPYVYKRLFQVKPLNDELFFEGREREIELLENAYRKWKTGGFSACAIYGEKGSGTSSLLNFFTRRCANDHIIRYTLEEISFSKEDFFAFANQLLEGQALETKEFTDQDAVIETFKQLPPTVIILEDTQQIYLKRIGGFEALKMLFELISATSGNIFWIVEFTEYAWNYLQKTHTISAYFKYHIPLSSLRNNQIVNLIMKRHKVSGYRLQFVATFPSKTELKKLSRLNEGEQQLYLQEKFFNSLNQFAQSNISLALLYWLRSTLEVTNNTIYVGILRDMKFEFLSRMGNESIFTLHALLLHDSLSLAEHAELFNYSEDQSKRILMVLEDNGILNQKAGRYTINRLLYRQVVNVLRNRNILH